jgi:anti-sigma regulatory factor (Ser/Thr protein kinase)
MTTTPWHPPGLSPAQEAPALASNAWSRAFPATAAQVREARRFLADVLDGGPEADDATLCLSELVTNATVHSRSRRPGGHFTVHAAIHAGLLRVEVRDEGGPWTWPGRNRGGQHGRGLLIVAQLAHDWGRSGDGTTGWTVWFTITLNTQPATTSPHPGGKTTMTEASPPAPAGAAHYDTQDMHAIRAGLAACGLTTHLTDARAGLDLTATLRPTGKNDAEFWIDEDGYAELRYWNPPGTPPAQVTATAIRALQAVTSPPPGTGPRPT